MKNILSIILVMFLGFALTSCGSKDSKESPEVGTHVHEDGTVHSNDAHKSTNPNQESFEVEDNDAEHIHEDGDHDTEEHAHEHSDEDGHDHDHGEEDGHDHDSDGH